MTLVRPFLKWPGGKYRLVKILKSHLRQGTQLIEPFVGAGALFLNTDYPKVHLNDVNPDLIGLYQQIQTKGDKFITEAKRLFVKKNNCAKRYYHLRAQFNLIEDITEKAFLFLYLNRHGYNGLCRYNAKGGYNVPFGDYKRPYFPERELHYFYEKSHKTRFDCLDYATLLNKYLKKPSLKNFVFYCDPPYAPLSQTAYFTGYAGKNFTLEDQKKLAIQAKALAEKGATVIISNHDTPFTRDIYQTAALHQLQVSRNISCNISKRLKVGEIIAVYHHSD